MDPVPESSSPTSRVHATREGDAMVLTVAGALDIHAGAELVDAVSRAVRAGSTRLDIDLSGIDGYDDHGASALLACRDAARTINGGLHYRTCSGGAGQDVLLHAYATEG
jgi:anti-anti-sigma regulatory factor